LAAPGAGLIIVVDQLQRVGNRAPSNDRIAGLGDIGDRERMPASTMPTYYKNRHLAPATVSAAGFLALIRPVPTWPSSGREK